MWKGRGEGCWCGGERGGPPAVEGRDAPSPADILCQQLCGQLCVSAGWTRHMGTFLNPVFLQLFCTGGLVLVPLLRCPR